MFFIKLNLILEHKGLNKANEFINNNYQKFCHGGYIKIEKFLKKYFSYSYTDSLDKPFYIFKYMTTSNFLNIFLNSNYCRSIPKEKIEIALIDALKAQNRLADNEEFVMYFIHQLNLEDIIKNYKKYPSSLYYYIAIKILEEKDIALVLSLPYEFLNSSIRQNSKSNENVNDFIENNLNYYFKKEDIEKYVLETDYDFKNILFLIDEEKSFFENMNYIFNLLLIKKNNIKDEDELYNIYTNFLGSMFEIESNYIMYDKVLNSDDIILKKAWILIDVDNPFTELLDEFICFSDAFLTDLIIDLYILDLDEKFNCLIKKLFMENKERFLNILINIIKMNEMKISDLDYVLDYIYKIEPDYIMSKTLSLELLKLGTKHHYKLMHYSYLKEERVDIYNSLSDLGRTDLLTLYGPFLITGNACYIVKNEELDSNQELLLKLKK